MVNVGELQLFSWYDLNSGVRLNLQGNVCFTRRINSITIEAVLVSVVRGVVLSFAISIRSFGISTIGVLGNS